MPADPATLAAARHVLAQLGVTLADLQTTDPAPRPPTIAEYLPRVTAAAGPGARHTYGTYWDRMATTWPDRPLDTITASDIEALKQQMIQTARTRSNSRNGRHAGEHLIAAARAFYTRAIADNLIPATASPAHRIAKPRRLPSTRRALTEHELE
ncbi:integrase [Plantactinospora sp. WMMB782]|uniref:integrase n=1 Tax=Plantactinospora sp. WMMB782 TaxID=3404121 RepID=UPI003B964663